MLVTGYSAFEQSENTYNATSVTMIATSRSGYYGVAQSTKKVFTSAIEYLSFFTTRNEFFCIGQ
jgi:hypothetical protein